MQIDNSFSTIKQDDLFLYTRPNNVVSSSPVDGQGLTSDLGAAISNFHIQLDNMGNTARPGEVLSGRVIMDVWSAISIRFVEFILQGHSTVVKYKSLSAKQHPTNEIYIDERIELVTPPSGSRTMVLAPGKYVSKFSCALPGNLPASVRSTKFFSGIVFDITYMAKANVAADVESRSIGPMKTEHTVKIIKSCKKLFTVQPLVSFLDFPAATNSISHAEQITTCCSLQPTSILLKLDRNVYAAGDVINVQIEILSPKKKAVRKLVCDLDQVVVFWGKKRDKQQRQVLLQCEGQVQPQSSSAEHMVRAVFHLPLLDSLCPSTLMFCRLLQVTYHLRVSVRLRGWGGSVLLEIPVTVAPSCQHEELEPKVSLFNKPIMPFPQFSANIDTPEKGSTSHSPVGTLRNSHSFDQRSAASTQRGGKYQTDKPWHPEPSVTIKYINDFRLCNNCTGCCGVGIHEA